jgi:hypothetical protein
MTANAPASSKWARTRRVSRVQLSCLALTLACVGCSTLPHRTILITDSKGKPIPDAYVTPYPILIRNMLPGSRGNLTDSRGRVELYDVRPPGPYWLYAEGFARRSVAFPERDDTTYTLKRAD